MPTIATCKLVPASCIDSTLSELDHISKWAMIEASISNLKLNHAMTREMVVKRPRSKPIALSPLILASSGSRRWLFLRVLVAHGNHGERLFAIVRATSLLSSHGYVMPPLFGGDLPLYGNINALT